MPTTHLHNHPGTMRQFVPISARSTARLNMGLSLTISALVMLALRRMSSGVLGRAPADLSIEAASHWLAAAPPLDAVLAVALRAAFVVASAVFMTLVAAAVEGVWLRAGTRNARLPLPSTVRRWRDAAFALTLVVPASVLTPLATAGASTGERAALSATPRPTLAAVERRAADPAPDRRRLESDERTATTAPTMASLVTTGPGTSTARSPSPGEPGNTTARDPRPPTTADSTRTDGHVAARSTSAPPSSETADAGSLPASTYTVKAGDSFWSIAEHQARRHDTTASLDDVAALWLRVVRLNRGALHDPSNPDLIRPGDRVLVPGWE